MNINNSQDLLKIVVSTMEHIEHFKKMTGIEKKEKVVYFVSNILHENVHDKNLCKIYKDMIPIMIENVIFLSKHKLLVNKIQNRLQCLKGCFIK